jgi:hypothetical protein
MAWPAYMYSPDLNPIETVWNMMKDLIQRRLQGQRNPTLVRLRSLVQEAWEQIPEELPESLVGSMGERCWAVVEAEGGSYKVLESTSFVESEQSNCVIFLRYLIIGRLFRGPTTVAK